MTTTASPTAYPPHVLRDQNFYARKSRPGEGGNYVVKGPLVGIVCRVATLDPEFAAASARRFQEEWDAMDITHRHLRMHSGRGTDCLWCAAVLDADARTNEAAAAGFTERYVDDDGNVDYRRPLAADH